MFAIRSSGLAVHYWIAKLLKIQKKRLDWKSVWAAILYRTSTKIWLGCPGFDGTRIEFRRMSRRGPNLIKLLGAYLGNYLRQVNVVWRINKSRNVLLLPFRKKANCCFLLWLCWRLQYCLILDFNQFQLPGNSTPMFSLIFKTFFKA